MWVWFQGENCVILHQSHLQVDPDEGESSPPLATFALLFYLFLILIIRVIYNTNLFVFAITLRIFYSWICETAGETWTTWWSHGCRCCAADFVLKQSDSFSVFSLYQNWLLVILHPVNRGKKCKKVAQNTPEGYSVQPSTSTFLTSPGYTHV